jgi:hypothetical protein
MVAGSRVSVAGSSTDAGSVGAGDIGTRLHTAGSRTGWPSVAPEMDRRDDAVMVSHEVGRGPA